MSRLERAKFFYFFWQTSYYRTFSQCAFKQMMRYHNRIAELMGYHSDYN